MPLFFCWIPGDGAEEDAMRIEADNRHRAAEERAERAFNEEPFDEIRVAVRAEGSDDVHLYDVDAERAVNFYACRVSDEPAEIQPAKDPKEG